MTLDMGAGKRERGEPGEWSLSPFVQEQLTTYPDPHLCEEGEVERIVRDSLDDAHASLVILRYLGGMEMQDVARLAGVKQGMAQYMRQRAFDRLRPRLRRYVQGLNQEAVA